MTPGQSLAHLNSSMAELEAADAELLRLEEAAHEAVIAGDSAEAVKAMSKTLADMRVERERLYRVAMRARIEHRDRRAA